MRKFLEIIVENFPTIEKEIVNQVQEAQSPTQDKPKEKHAKTHTNQTNKATGTCPSSVAPQGIALFH